MFFDSFIIGNFIIALREGLEAALIVGVIVAFLVKVGRRDVIPAVWTGVVIATIIPLGAGAFMTWGPYSLKYEAQEIIGGSLSLVAVAFITWMIFWMAKNGRRLQSQVKETAAEALAKGSTTAVVWIAITAVGREGIETAVFIWATVKSSADKSVLTPVIGVLAGLLVAIFLGWLIYRGSKAINLRAFFFVTGILLIFVAAGVVSYGIGDLQEANLIPGWGIHIYDLTPYFDGHIPGITPDAWWFVLIEAMFQVNLSPTHLQFTGWLLYLVLVLPLFCYITLRRRSKNTAPKVSSVITQTSKASNARLKKEENSSDTTVKTV